MSVRGRRLVVWVMSSPSVDEAPDLPWWQTSTESGQSEVDHAHDGCGYIRVSTQPRAIHRGSLQRFGEFLGGCDPSEGLSRPSVELVSCKVEVVLRQLRHVGAFGKVLA